MAKRKIEELISELSLPIAEKHAYELVDVEFVKEGGNWYLRVYIDKPGGINIDDCQLVSEDLSAELDKIDPIEQGYFLEVSSPGLERPLKTDRDYEKYRGESVELKLFKPMDGKKVFEGKLIGLYDKKIQIDTGTGGILEFEREKVALVKRILKF